jgi:hypothetical protein
VLDSRIGEAKPYYFGQGFPLKKTANRGLFPEHTAPIKTKSLPAGRQGSDTSLATALHRLKQESLSNRTGFKRI